MKKVIFYAFSALLFVTTSCDKDDDNTPEPVNEEEVITTLTVKLTPTTGTAIELKSFDADGDGPNVPVLSVSGALAANTSYAGVIELLNELETPAEDITDEVNEESDEHQEKNLWLFQDCDLMWSKEHAQKRKTKRFQWECSNL